MCQQQVLQAETLDLGDVAPSLAPMLRRLIAEDISLEIRAEPGVRAVEADRGQIEQVIVNLAVNARDAMTEGGHLTISVREIGMSAAQAERLELETGDFVELSIVDTGHGIDKRALSQIFEPFYTTKPVGEGTGLGLATVHGIVKQSDGSIEVESAPGRGTCFRVYLAPSENRPLPRAPGNAAVIAPGEEVVLVVEDEDALRTLAGRILRRAGYEVKEAANGKAALKLLEQPESANWLSAFVAVGLRCEFFTPLATRKTRSCGEDMISSGGAFWRSPTPPNR